MKRIVFRLLKSNRYSITALIAAMEKENIEIETILEKNFEKILEYNPEDTLIAYSFMSFDIFQVEKEIPLLKEKGFKVIAGGPHPSAMPEKTEKIGFDHIFIGEGEKTFTDFLKGKISEKFIASKEFVDLNYYPPFAIKNKHFMPIEITRGCPFGCGYCQTPYLFGRIVRHREPGIIHEYAKLGVKHNRKIARFITPNSFGYGSKNGVTPNIEKLEELLSGLRKVGIEEIYLGSFPSDVRPESVTEEVLKLIKKYVDNKMIIIGAQSGSNEILKKINRGHSLEEIERALSLVSAHGFIPYVDFIFGFPFETDEDIKKTFDFMDKITEKYNAVIHSHTFMPLPGTPLFDVGPGKLNKKYYKKLGDLSRNEKLAGYWHKQEQLSQKIFNYFHGGEI
ncbi:radical SAM protein [Marinitoga sp. 1135]|uniref:B12-binding domain/radical SAM domain protein, MJ_1487 family n=1 Tax=Marinitoga piezophila (strain DSM 14283 / JCM 11233 / KA3) TaxID=443254 RepID=H2J4X1_MARPK|nr:MULTISPECIES: TIGR04013 family B12-binding domain/radical SAM domain-containing protein [Marinitoga]AEX84906.1 B12-binding domain/radical SAM domain protein, MJ_1487 family [Marinitoga piezophila KA3]NUU95140.1 radical SAM protein [Marinitoga sp. 1135]NUU97072.1 radical SAM protein [Marinitoga sp. 1138]